MLAAVPPTVTLLAIEPDVAVIAPVIVASVAVNAPALVTLKGALAKVLLPRLIPSSVDNDTLVTPSPAIKFVEPIVKPPTVPVAALMFPRITVLLKVVSPLFSILHPV